MSDDLARRDPLPGTPATEGRSKGEESLAVSTVPRYRILGVLGIGGMGVVYRAEDTRLERTVALKLLPPTLTPSPRAKARFRDEARAAAALDHPNLCTIYDVGETAEGQLYLAMACYEGETLKQRLERGPLPVAEALHIALQAAHGLAKAHRHGIVHRDIKPANLMLNADGLVKILDFGVARLPDQALAGPHLGTPGYMSPEQERARTVDARSDVWSLGVVLREMLTGWRPSGGQGEAPPGGDTTVPLLPPDTPPGLDGVLSRMLAREPADRYPDAAALLADLSALERAAAGTEEIPTTVGVHRRLPAWTVVLTAVALTIAAGSGLLSVARRHGGSGPDPSQVVLTRLTDLPGKEWFPSLTPGGDLFVYARKTGNRSRLVLQQVEGGTTMDVPYSPEGDSQPAVSPGGSQIAFRSEREGGGIFVMGLMGDSVRRVTDFGFNPAWSPDGKEIVFATAEVDNPQVRRHTSEIYRVNLATNQLRLVQSGGVQPTWSPHGFRIAFWERLSSGQRVIWTVPAGGGKAVPVTQGESVDWNPVWSPDGRYLYFASDRNGVTNLWRVPIDERSGGLLGKPEPVATSGQTSMLFSLSRDGRRIAYTSDETRTVVEKVAFDPVRGTAGPAVTIYETPRMVPALHVSPDGRWLVYQTSVPQENLFIVRSDGKDRRQLTDEEHWHRLPRWSPDGTRIAFYSNRGGTYEIWILNVDGGGLERVAGFPGKEMYHPIWSPDSRWLACDIKGQNEVLIDLSLPLAERRPEPLPPADRGMGFSASSWSVDGRWLAGSLQQPDGHLIPGVVLYSLEDRSYVRITDSGTAATWLSDNRRLLYWDSGKIFLLDTVTRKSRQVLSTPPASEYNDFALSPDDRTLYLARNTEQGDIWLLTLQ